MNAAAPATVPPRPSGSRAVLERQADGLTLKVPPLGLRRGGGFLLWWTLLWNAMTLPFAVAFYYEALSGAAAFDDKPATFLWFLFPLPFLFAGVVSLLIVLHRGRRRAALAVVGGRLHVLRVGLFHTERGEWARDELADLRAVPNDVEQNVRPSLALQIRPKNGPTFALLDGRDPAELKWMAAVLRQALSLSAEPPTPSDAVGKQGRADEPTAGSSPSSAVGRSYEWIGAGVAGAVMAGFLWLLVNAVTINGVGLPARLGGTWLNVYSCIAAGAMIGGASGFLYQRRQRWYAGQLARVAAAMEFAYRPEASREALGDFLNLRLFKKWSSASNRLTGRAGGLPVEMVDYVYVVRGDDGDSHVSQTVLLAPAEPALPVFELRPRHLGMKLLSMLSVQGIAFAAAATDDERDGIERFGRLYHLSEGLEELLEAAGVAVAGDEGAESPARPRPGEAAIRQLFAPGLLRFFADHPGWSVESDGRHLALWRRQTVIPAADRPAFLAEALEVHQALTQALLRPETPAAVAAGAPPVDRLVVRARVLGLVLGLIAGFFAGAVLGLVGAASCDPFKDGCRYAAFFFGGPILGLVLGAAVGSRVLYYPIFLLMRSRRAGRRPDA